MENEENIPVPEKVGANPFFVILYLLVFVGMILYPAFVYGFSLSSYTWPNILSLFVYLVPAFFFALFGIMTVRSKLSFVYAICSAVVGLIGVVFVEQMGWVSF